MVGVEPIVDVAHAMETVLREANRAAGQLPAGALEPLLKGVRAIEQRVQALGKQKRVAAAPTGLIGELNALRPPGSETANAAVGTSLPPDLWAKLSAGEREQLRSGDRRRPARAPPALPAGARAGRGRRQHQLGAGADGGAGRDRQGRPAIGGRHRRRAGRPGLRAHPAHAKPRTRPSPKPAPARRGTSSPSRSTIRFPPSTRAPSRTMTTTRSARRGIVRVEVARLDDALERLAALVVTQFRLTRALAGLRTAGADVRALAQVLAENGRQLRDLRASIMRARMVPVLELLERVPLIVRGLSRATGKNARVEISTGKAELDKAVAERIFPAIVQLVRNAVDHALELPVERRAAGKPEVGVIQVTCFERANNQLELTIADDGRGIDAVAVARRAGVPVPATDDALLELLTRPGLSTKTEITTTSGRGVGMDIVKRVAVDELRGELSMQTVAGRGTTFTLRIPLSITIVDAFSFVCGGETFVVPVAMVEEIQEVDPSRMIRGPIGARPAGRPDRGAPRARPT